MVICRDIESVAVLILENRVRPATYRCCEEPQCVIEILTPILVHEPGPQMLTTGTI
jgi:hypothetical protein